MDYSLPELGEGVYEAELIRWLVQEGDFIKRGTPILEAMTDKATMEIPAAFSGTITKLIAKPGSKIRVRELVLAYSDQATENPKPDMVPLKLGASVAESSARVPSSSSSVSVKNPSQRNGNHPSVTPAISRLGPPAAPSVRHLARQMNIPLADISGTGPGGRILLADLSSFITANQNTAKAERATERKKLTVNLDVGKAGTRQKLAGMRRKIAEHMMLAKQFIPAFTYVDEIDLTELVQLRSSLKTICQKRNLKLTFLAFFVKAVAMALKELPIVNATLDEKTEEIVMHDHYHIGIAVAVPQGLMVPVIHDADQKHVLTIAKEIDQLSQQAKSGRIPLEKLRGGTFTVTSVGNLGGLISTPIINYPEVGIMGIGKVVKRPVYDEAGEIKPADLAYLSFSFDHRVVDGAIGAMFSNAVMANLKSPAALLLPEVEG